MSANNPLHKESPQNDQNLKQETVKNDSEKAPMSNITKIFVALFACAIVAVGIYCIIAFSINNDDEDDKGDNYKVWCVGNCDSYVTTSSEPGTIFVGGGVSRLIYLVYLFLQLTLYFRLTRTMLLHGISKIRIKGIF
jgi:hypothetical protein